MPFIKINKIRTYSFIGCMDEEKKIGKGHGWNMFPYQDLENLPGIHYLAVGGGLPFSKKLKSKE